MEKITKSDKKYHLDINHIGNTRDFGGISLVQAGRMNCGEETVIPLHAHIDWFELEIKKAGYRAEIYIFLSLAICTK